MTTTNLTDTTDANIITASQRRTGVTARHARGFLLADAVLTAGNGLAYLALMTVLDDLFGVGRGLLATLGIFLLLIGVGVAVLATRRPIPRLGVHLLAGLNVAWVAASVLFVILADLTTVGVVWTIVQAVVVLAFTIGQFRLVAAR